jgi:hypothetical protein
MSNPYRAMCAELLNDLEHSLGQHCLQGEIDNDPLIIRARALLDQPVPEESASMDYARQCHTQAVAALIALEALADAADQFGPAGGADGKALAAEVEKARGTLARATPQPPADGEVADHVVEVPKKVALTTRYQAHLREDRLFHICDEAQPLIVQWWNESRKSRHGVKATWTEAAWKASVYRVANLPECQQVLLCKAGVEHGWQALKPEYLKDELAKPTGDGRPMPKDPPREP